jgi:phage terminase large subunit-like protein
MRIERSLQRSRTAISSVPAIWPERSSWSQVRPRAIALRMRLRSSFPHGRHDDQVDSISQALNNPGYSYDTSLSWVE